jgi:transposase
MSPEYVRPYVKAQKNDDRDAEGIAEAASRPTMRFVDLKSEEQLDIQSLHRVRSRLVAERTTLNNQMRAILLERGLIFAAGRCKFESAVDSLLNEQANSLSGRVQRLVAELRDEWKMLDTKIAALNAEFLSLARDDLATRRLTDIPGMGGTERHSANRRYRKRQQLRSCPRSWRVVRTCTTTIYDRRQATAAGHHKAWQRLPPNFACSRCASGHAHTQSERHSSRALATRHGPATQRRPRRAV